MIIYSEVFQNRRTLILYTIASLLIFSVGYFYMTNAVAISSQCNSIRELCFGNFLVYQYFGKILASISGIFSLYFAYMLIRPFRIFYLTDEGFWTKDYGFIKWDDVTKLYMGNIAYQTAIFFNVKNIEKINLNLFQKIVRHFKKGDLYIELSSGFNEVNEVFKLMKTHCRILTEK